MEDPTTSYQGCKVAIAPSSGMATALVMTEKMVACARNDSWDEVTELESERRQILEHCFSTSIAIDKSDLFSEALAAMLQMNEEVISLLEIAKTQVAIKSADQQHKKRSIGHYLDIDEA